ncbi:hypothetical protein ACI513_09865 [Chryseobacterium sp. M5]|uniref:hypothetical protein n=1 Tax=Chryseobacterium sp. M5 TaxID=3379128 RepID=UPI003857BF02
MNKEYNKLFIDRTKSIYLDISPVDTNRTSKISGNHPIYFDKVTNLVDRNKYYYFLTIGDEFSALLDKKCLSIFVRHDIFDIETIYPKFDMLCIVHEPTGYSSDTSLQHPNLTEGSLVFSKKEKADEARFIKIGGLPDLIQDEDYYSKDLDKDGYGFIFQFDEFGYPDDFIKGNCPFAFGSVYFYGKTNNESLSIENIIAGYFQFS